MLSGAEEIQLLQNIVRAIGAKKTLDLGSYVILIGSRPSDHYFRSVCLFVCLFVCADFFSAVFDPISIKLGHILYVWV